ncbi:MAG TPA: hypothetical protein VJP04_12865 [Terriglobales bacterium]|nr:hypothetical protein [Terriglobales bacterium]
MKRTFYLCSVAVILLAGVAAAQSVADAARQTRKQNANKPAAKVFTNDDLPTNAPISVTGQPPATDEDGAKTADGGDSANAGKTDADKAKADADKDKPKSDEDKKTFAEKRDAAIQQWKQRFAAQKQQISLLEREIDVMQREYRLRAAAYYADAGNALRNQAPWAQQERDYREKLDLKQKKLVEAKQKLEDMQDQARREGMPSSVAD